MRGGAHERFPLRASIGVISARPCVLTFQRGNGAGARCRGRRSSLVAHRGTTSIPRDKPWARGVVGKRAASLVLAVQARTEGGDGSG
jgi:hypothetical protein